MNEVLKNRLKALGFKTVKDEVTGCVDYVNEVKEYVHLVISPMFNEVFIWIIEDLEGNPDDGTKILLETDSLEKAIELSKIIIGVDFGF